MDAKVVLFVLCASVASSRHLVDVDKYSVQPFAPGPDAFERHRSATVLERRNIDYGSKTNLDREPNIDTYLYNDDGHRIPERHSHRYHNHNREELSENSDDNNNIGYVQDEYKLRTNVPSDTFTYTTEYISDVDVYTNINERTTIALTQKHFPSDTKVEKSDMNDYNRNGNVQDTHKPVTTPKTNKNIVTNTNNQQNKDVSNHSDQNNLHEKRVFVNNNTNEPVNGRRGDTPKTNQPDVTKTPRTNDTRPIASDRGKAIGSNGIPNPKDDETDIPWVWGTVPTTTEVGLLDRNAFNGDQCPTGKAKFEGICVDKH